MRRLPPPTPESQDGTELCVCHLQAAGVLPKNSQSREGLSITPCRPQSPQRAAPTWLWDGGRDWVSEHHGSFVRPRKESGAATGSRGVRSSLRNLSPTTSLPSACSAPAHAQYAHKLGWLGEGTDWHPHLKGQCHLCLHPTGAMGAGHPLSSY